MRKATTLVIAGLGMLVTSWVISTPAGANPDEWAHYLRGLAASRGDIAGAPAADYDLPSALPPQLAYLRQTVRRVHVPAGRDPAGFSCNAFDAARSARCLNEATPDTFDKDHDTIVGAYQPLYYLLTAPAFWLAKRAVPAVLIGRGIGTFICLLLVSLGAWAFARAARSPRAWLPLLAGVTPMVAYLLSTFSPSALEVASGLGLSLSLLAATHPERDEPLAWWAFAATGTMLAASRTLGPGWLGALVLAVVIYRGWPLVMARIAAAGWRAPFSVLCVGLGVVTNRLWESLHGPHVAIGPRDFRDNLHFGLGGLRTWARQALGMFQWLDTALPDGAVVALGFALGGLCLWALAVGSRRDRLAVLLAMASVVLAPLSLYIVLIRDTGFELQARYVLPFVVILPVLAADIVVRRARHTALGASVFGLTWAVCQLAGWWMSAHRSAVGHNGPLGFWRAPEWSPPAGWALSIGLAFAGAGVVGIGVLLPVAAWVIERRRSETVSSAEELPTPP